MVSKKAVPPEAWEALDGGGPGVVARAHGQGAEDERAPGGYEIDVTAATVLQAVHDYPITPKEHGTAFLMEHRHLWLRSHAPARDRSACATRW